MRNASFYFLGTFRFADYTTQRRKDIEIYSEHGMHKRNDLRSLLSYAKKISLIPCFPCSEIIFAPLRLFD